MHLKTVREHGGYEMSQRVSIVIATLNAEPYLERALDSIENQTHTDYEVMMVDGGSEDKTLEIAKRYSFVVPIKQLSSGLAGAWNEGILAARANYITFLDSDDYWDCQVLEWHLRAFEQNPDCRASIGKVQFFLSEEMQKLPHGFKASLLNDSHMAYMPGCFMGKRNIFDQLGMFDEGLQVTSDLIWFAQLKISGVVIEKCQEVVLHKRVHQKNLSYTSTQALTYDQEITSVLHTLLQKKNR